jgi:hypothetical protein
MAPHAAHRPVRLAGGIPVRRRGSIEGRAFLAGTPAATLRLFGRGVKPMASSALCFVLGVVAPLATVAWLLTT